MDILMGLFIHTAWSRRLWPIDSKERNIHKSSSKADTDNHTYLPRIPRLCAGTPRPLWLQISVMRVSAWIMSVRTGRLENQFIERPRPRPENCTTEYFSLPLLPRPTRIYRETAPDPTRELGASRDRVSRQRRLALLGEGTESLATNARSTDGGHRG